MSYFGALGRTGTEGQVRTRTDRRKGAAGGGEPTQSIYLGGQWVDLGARKMLNYRHEGKTIQVGAGTACKLGAKTAEVPLSAVPGCVAEASKYEGLRARVSHIYIKQYYDKWKKGAAVAATTAATAEQAVLAAKAAKTKQILLYGGAVVAAVAIGLVATKKK